MFLYSMPSSAGPSACLYLSLTHTNSTTLKEKKNMIQSVIDQSKECFNNPAFFNNIVLDNNRA